MRSDIQKATRKDIIELLVGKFSRAGCISIIGLPGSGKTWLTGELRASLQKNGWNSVVLRCRDAWSAEDFYSSLSDILRLYAGDKEVPFCHDPDRFLDFLTKRGITLIIDDFHLAESRKTLDLLEKASTSAEGKVIVASRTRPKTAAGFSADIFSYPLPGLTEPETWEMIDSIFSFQNRDLLEDEAKRKVYSLSKGHPFSVKAICALLLSGEMTPARLAGDRKIDEIISDFFERSFWKSQNRDFRWILKQLCVFRIPVDREILEDISGNYGMEALARLRDSCLAEFDPYGKITLPMLLKSFISGKTAENEISALHEKAADLLQKRFGSEPAYLKEICYHFLCAGQKQAAIDALIKYRDAALFYPAADDLVPIIRNVLKAGYRVQDLKILLVSQLLMQGRFAEAKAELAGISGFFRQYYEACIEDSDGNSEKAQEMLLHLQEKADSGLKILLEYRIAQGYLFLGKYEKSREYLDRMRGSRDFDLSPNARVGYFKLSAQVYNCSGDLEKALTELTLAADLARQSGLRSRLGFILYSKGYYLMMLNRLEQAGQVAQEALKFCEEQDSTKSLGYVHDLLGALCKLAGDFRESIEHYLISQGFFRCNNDKINEASSQAETGGVYLRLGETEVAERYLAKAMETIERFEDLTPRCVATEFYCEYLIITGRFPEALSRLQSLEKHFQGSCPINCTYFNFLMGSVLEKSGEAGLAREYYSRYRLDLDNMPAEARKLKEEEESWWIGKMREPGKIRLLVREESSCIGSMEADAVRKKAESYEIFADFISLLLLVDGRKVDLFNKKIISKLLQELASNPGREFDAKQLYPKIWGRDFDPVADAGTFRSNISRLRRALDPEDPLRFVRNTEDSTGCCFNKSADYCILLP
ncbi:MAG: winged helix-turn-helix domain-containing protein [Candidatus Wallbacteria bacterium]|nr:winged helix-turn-helix domain-containing protein [Candidatus Wallbacteria bacterium]